MGCYHLCEPWTLARSAVPTQHLLFGLSTTSSPALSIFNVPIQWREKSFQPWNLEQLPCMQEEGCGGDLLHSWGERSGDDATSRKERSRCSLPSPLWGCFTSWDTWHEKWAPAPASALTFMCVSGSVESIIYFSCRPKRWVCLSDDFVPK